MVGQWAASSPASSRETRLFTTLPILWSESPDIGGIVRGEGEAHWARAALETRGQIVALDSLAAITGDAPLLMAQPRPLSPAENVALDRWVRNGGRVLLFADPMLTAPSAYPIGDRRRPQDVVLISPLLRHWGLRLEFDDAQTFGERQVGALGAVLPVNLPGRLTPVPGADGTCAFAGEGLVADCRIGRGRVVAIADAALFESGESIPMQSRETALLQLFGELARD